MHRPSFRPARLRSTLSIGIAALVASMVAISAWLPSAASAEEITCTGSNMIDTVAASDAQTLAYLKREALKVPHGNGILWRVSTPGQADSFIFGTMHLSDPRLLALPPRTKAAFDQSTTLALEITEILDPQKMAAQAFKIIQMTSYLDGTTLEDRLKPELVPKLQRKVLEAAGLPWSVANKMKPWALMGAIALPACEYARKRAGKPFLDMALGQDAKAAGKTIVGLETLQGQLKAMNALPEAEMIIALDQIVTLGPHMEDMFETMIQLYQREELGLLWTLLRHMDVNGISKTPTDAGYAEFQRTIIDQRNFGMADTSEPLLKKGGAFIAVGALHLPGQRGLIQILKDRGYTVSRP